MKNECLRIERSGVQPDPWGNLWRLRNQEFVSSFPNLIFPNHLILVSSGYVDSKIDFCSNLIPYNFATRAVGSLFSPENSLPSAKVGAFHLDADGVLTLHSIRYESRTKLIHEKIPGDFHLIFRTDDIGRFFLAVPFSKGLLDSNQGRWKFIESPEEFWKRIIQQNLDGEEALKKFEKGFLEPGGRSKKE